MLDIFNYVNITVALVLWTVGYFIKHTKVMNKIKNNYIPVILIVLGIILSFALSGISVESFTSGLATALVCVGTHKSGRELFSMNGTLFGKKEDKENVSETTTSTDTDEDSSMG